MPNDEDHSARLTDAVDAILAHGEASLWLTPQGQMSDDAERADSEALAQALSELRDMYETVDAPIHLDPREHKQPEVGTNARRLRVPWLAGTAVAAAAVIAFAVFVPFAVDRDRPQFAGGDADVADDVSGQVPVGLPVPKRSATRKVDVRAPRLNVFAIARSSYGFRSEPDAAPSRWPNTSAAQFTRVKTARFSMMSRTMDNRTSITVAPSMILKQRRKSHESDSNDRSGSSHPVDMPRHHERRLG